MAVAVMVSWIEKERGFGQRPDGYSFHLTHPDFEEFVKRYWDSMPDEVQDEYEAPGSPQIVNITDKFFKFLQRHKKKKGIRIQKWQWNKYKEHILK